MLGDGGGLLVPLGDEPALAAAMERLLRDSDTRASVGAMSRQFVQANFSLERMRLRYEELYTELLEKKGWRPQTSVTAAPAGRKLRVAIVAPTLRYVGGQAVQADLLMRQWNNDPDVEACFIPVDPALPRLLAWIERIPALRTLVRMPLYLTALWRGLEHADIAHIFSASYSSFLLAPVPAWFVARLRGKKTIINYRSGEARDHLQRSRFARAVLERVDRLVAPSGYLVEVFREFGLESQVVPNIIDLSQFSFRPRPQLRPHLVCTRGFHPYYSVDVVVRAFAEVQKLFPRAKLDLVGGGPSEAEIRKLVQDLGLEGVNFAGVATRQNIGQFYDAADIFINASNLDNMPVSVLEAFASGTPVVTTAPESMSYLVDDGRTGLLSEPGNAHALAENVLRVLRDADLASRLTSNAYQESKRYCWGVVREQWLEVYRSLAVRSETASEMTVVA